MRKVDFEELCDFAQRIIGRKNCQRLALLVEGNGTGNSEDNPYFSYITAPSFEQIKQMLMSKL